MNKKRKCGRPRRNMTAEEKTYVIAIEKNEMTFTEVTRILDVSCSTLYRWIDEVRQEMAEPAEPTEKTEKK